MNNKIRFLKNFFCLIKMWRHSGIGYQPHNRLNRFRLGYDYFQQIIKKSLFGIVNIHF